MDIPDTPDWLTKEFLERLLKNNEENPDENVQIINFKISNALPKWNNYLSSVLRVKIEYKTKQSLESLKTISLIIKVPVCSDMSVINNSGIIEKELAAYEELFPKLNSIIQKEPNEIILTPKFFKCELQNIIILEDLGADGYKMVDRRKQLDYEHSALVLRNIAKFHAASAVLHEQEPELVENFGSHLLICKDMDEEVKMVCDAMMGETHLEMICNEFEKWPESNRFVGFLKKLKPKFWDLYVESIYPGEGEFTILNHGDLYINNVLFNYDESARLQSLKLVDFQMMRYTSPTMDLMNFMHSSIPYEVLKTHFHALTKIYLDKLNENLEKYGSSKRLGEEEFRRSLEKRELFALCVCINSLPFIFAETEGIDDESTPDPADIMIQFIKNKTYRVTATKYLEDFSKKSWFQNFD